MFLLGGKKFQLSIMNIYLPVMKRRNLKYGNLGESNIMHGLNKFIISKRFLIQLIWCQIPDTLAFIKLFSLSSVAVEF